MAVQNDNPLIPIHRPVRGETIADLCERLSDINIKYPLVDVFSVKRHFSELGMLAMTLLKSKELYLIAGDNAVATSYNTAEVLEKIHADAPTSRQTFKTSIVSTNLIMANGGGFLTLDIDRNDTGKLRTERRLIASTLLQVAQLRGAGDAAKEIRPHRPEIKLMYAPPKSIDEEDFKTLDRIVRACLPIEILLAPVDCVARPENEQVVVNQ